MVEDTGYDPVIMPCKGIVFPTILIPHEFVDTLLILLYAECHRDFLVPPPGIELGTNAYKAIVIPLNYRGKFWLRVRGSNPPSH